MFDIYKLFTITGSAVLFVVNHTVGWYNLCNADIKAVTAFCVFAAWQHHYVLQNHAPITKKGKFSESYCMYEKDEKAELHYFCSYIHLCIRSLHTVGGYRFAA